MGFLAMLEASSTSMSKHKEYAPWKVCACCTLFAAAAYANEDEEAHGACLKILEMFCGDCWCASYQLQGHDPNVLRLIDADTSVLKPFVVDAKAGEPSDHYPGMCSLQLVNGTDDDTIGSKKRKRGSDSSAAGTDSVKMPRHEERARHQRHDKKGYTLLRWSNRT